jgi:hypothetical protein
MFIGNISVNAPVIFGINASEVARFTSGTIASGSFGIKYTTAATTTTAAALTCAGGIAAAGDMLVGSAQAFYFGATATDGTWRLTRSGNNLVIQRRESGSYVTKSTIAA